MTTPTQRFVLLAKGQFMFTELVMLGKLKIEQFPTTTRFKITMDRYRIFIDYKLDPANPSSLHEIANIVARCVEVEEQQALLKIPVERTETFIRKSLETTKPERIFFNKSE